QQAATEPSDVVLFNQNRQLADEVVRLSFEFARARALQLPGSATSDQSSLQTGDSADASSSTRYQNLVNAAAKSDAQVKQEQRESDALKQQLPGNVGSKRTRLEALIADRESELALAQA